MNNEYFKPGFMKSGKDISWFEGSWSIQQSTEKRSDFHSNNLKVEAPEAEVIKINCCIPNISLFLRQISEK